MPNDLITRPMKVEEFITLTPTNPINPVRVKKLLPFFPDCLDAVASGNPIRIHGDKVEVGNHRQAGCIVRLDQGTLSDKYEFTCNEVVRASSKAESQIAAFMNNYAGNTTNKREQLFASPDIPVVSKVLQPMYESVNQAASYVDAPRTDPKAIAARLGSLFCNDPKLFYYASKNLPLPEVNAVKLKKLQSHPVFTSIATFDPKCDLNPIIANVAKRVHPALEIIAELRTPQKIGEPSDWERIFNRGDTFELFLLDFALRGILPKYMPSKQLKAAIRKTRFINFIQDELQNFSGKNIDAVYYSIVMKLGMPKLVLTL